MGAEKVSEVDQLKNQCKIENQCLYIPEGTKIIPEDCFRNDRSFQTIHFPDSLEEIKRYAFQCCEELKRVVLPPSLKKMGQDAFYNCEQLESVQLPDGLEVICYHTFSGCHHLKKVIFGSGLKEIGEEAFERCESLQEIVFPAQLKKIGERCFVGCKSLRKINISNDLDLVMDEAFAECSNLVDVEADGLVYAPFLMNVFKDTLLLDEKRKKHEMLIIGHTVVDGRFCSGEVTIPDGILQIGPGAFLDCAGLKRVEIPSSVKAIDYNAFQGCVLLDEVKLPPELAHLSENVFKDCYSLRHLDLPTKFGSVLGGAFDGTPWLEARRQEGQPIIIGDTFYDGKSCKGSVRVEGVSSIAGGAFKGNHDLTEVTVGEGVKSIGASAFERCLNLKSLSLPTHLDEIGKRCFSHCYSLERLEIPEGVEDIGREMFYACGSLRELKLPTTIKNIYLKAFCRCPQLKKPSFSDDVCVAYHAIYRMEDAAPSSPAQETAQIVVIDDHINREEPPTWEWLHCQGVAIADEAYCGREDLTEIVIPEGVKFIGEEAFSGCSNLKKVVLPDSIEIIGKGAFFGTGIEELVFPKNLKYILRSAFEDCRLKRADLPDGLEYVGVEAFKKSDLTQVYIPSSVTDLGYGAFCECERLATVNMMCLPKSEDWGYFKGCHRLISFTGAGMTINSHDFEETALLRQPCEEVGDFSIRSGCLFDVKKGTLPSVVAIPEGVSSIGAEVFKNHEEIKEVQLPDSLCAIGQGAFSGCIQLEKINMPNNLRMIGAEAFSQCAFKRFDWPAGVTTMGRSVFLDCHALQEVTLPDTLLRIASPFWGTALHDIVLPKRVVSFGELKEFRGEESYRKGETLTILNDQLDWESKEMVYVSLCDLPDYILWRGDVSLLPDIHDQFKLLQGYARGLELGFEYGESCKRANDQLIKKYYQDYSPLYRFFSNVCLAVLTILNVILHIICYPYIWINEMGHMFSTVHKPSYFFDGLIRRWSDKLSRPHLFLNVASEAMIRYLMQKGWLTKRDAEDLLANRDADSGYKEYGDELYEALGKYRNGL